MVSCHKVENINSAQQKLPSREVTHEEEKWIIVNFILGDISRQAGCSGNDSFANIPIRSVKRAPSTSHHLILITAGGLPQLLPRLLARFQARLSPCTDEPGALQLWFHPVQTGAVSPPALLIKVLGWIHPETVRYRSVLYIPRSAPPPVCLLPWQQARNDLIKQQLMATL
ncbi:hypothetical protein DPEC_G00010690 [Dallia pectoralis]|uniref:Uncharacterized protein n=1 Tax=Dallia pectoralis TaxID=75939 RepID=A0ACC2HLJ5_DALPE|nr:hypothetical protein DPEC_G00010690 [Dallia pectoralis]